MAETDYEVEIIVRCKGNVIDTHLIKDEDYGWAMSRVASWAVLSYGEKDF